MSSMSKLPAFADSELLDSAVVPDILFRDEPPDGDDDEDKQDKNEEDDDDDDDDEEEGDGDDGNSDGYSE
jgi:hypothetical protein